MNEIERLQILEMIEKGIITAEEGVRLINSLPAEIDEGEAQAEEIPPAVNLNPAVTAPAPEVIQPAPAESRGTPPPGGFESGVKRWQRWWWIPLAVGIGLTVVSGLLMLLAYQKNGFGFWFACLWFPLLLGVFVITIAAASRSMRWLHVRVHQEAGEWPRTISISMPVPIRFVAWVLRTFHIHIQGMDSTRLDEVILALDKTSPIQPFYVHVDEGESGEKVEVYIG